MKESWFLCLTIQKFVKYSNKLKFYSIYCHDDQGAIVSYGLVTHAGILTNTNIVNCAKVNMTIICMQNFLLQCRQNIIFSQQPSRSF